MQMPTEVLTRGDVGGMERKVDEERGTVPAILSTGAVARDGFIVDPRGWELDNFRKNPVVLWNHGGGLFGGNDIPIARDIETTKTDSELLGLAQFDLEDTESDRIFGKIARGFINAPSVRWKPIRTEVRIIDGREVLAFVQQDLLEYSFVSVPADTTAGVLRSLKGEAIDVRSLMESAPTLDETLKRLEAAMAELREGRLDESSRARVLRLHADLGSIIATSAPAPGLRDDAPRATDRGRIADLSEQLAGVVAELATPLDIEGAVLRGLSAATGKTPERIKQEMTA